MPQINIVARTNGVGLDQDVDLVYNALTNCGMEVSISHCREISAWSRILPSKAQYDANIFFERVFPRWLSRANRNFLIPNQERFPHRHLRHLKKINAVLCKTEHALDIFSQHAKAQYIGFTSNDRALSDIDTEDLSCFHLAGRSTLKGTETILALWDKHPSWPHLTLIQCSENAPKSVPNNVRLISRYLSSEELIQEMNRHDIHLCTSLSEGWGHHIVEAMSCRALVITTDAPPMNEIITPSTGILVPYHQQEARHLGTNFFVAPDALEASLEQCFQLSKDERLRYGKQARQRFEKIREKFVSSFPEVVQSLLP